MYEISTFELHFGRQEQIRKYKHGVTIVARQREFADGASESKVCGVNDLCVGGRLCDDVTTG
jgi:hypothetical protein